MKKNLFVAAAMMVAMTACVKEADVVTPQENEKIWVEFTAGVQTKVVLNDGETDTVTWEEEDVISVNGVDFTIPEGDDAISADGKSAKFGASVEPSFLEAENFTAVYPATAAEWDGLAPQITVPVAQDGSADIVAMATVEKLTETLNFKHVVSFIKFQVPSSVETVTVSATEVIAGTVEKVAFAEEEGVTVVSYDAVSAEGNKTITVSLGADAEFEPGTFYYVAVLPGMKTNLTLSFDGATYKTWETLNIKQGMIAKVSAKKERNLAYKLADEVVTEVTHTFGNVFVAPVLTGEKVGAVYSSADEAVATVNDEGVVTVLATGTTTITASVAEDNTFLAGEASYTLTVTAAPKASRNLEFSKTSVTATVGVEFVEPELTGMTDGVEYASSDSNVAAVDSETGEVTIVAEGQATITASAPESDAYLSGEASYIIDVSPAPKAERNLAFNPESVTISYGDTFTAPVLTGETTGVNYESSEPEVATVTSDGVVTILKVGTTIITASAIENATHLTGVASYTLTVNKAARTLTFTESALEVTYGADVTEPTLNGVNDGETVVYTSSDETVATVDASGAVTVLKAGSTTITATLAATDNHEAATASYALTVNKAARNLTFSKASATAKTEGEDFAEPILNGEKTGVEYTSSNTTIATVDKTTGQITALKAGTVTITATAAANDTHKEGSASYSLTVKEPSLWRLVGKFNNVDKWDKQSGSIPMYAVSGQTNTYVAENVKLTSNDIWKFLYNDNWDQGWVGSHDANNWDGNVYSSMQNHNANDKYGSYHSYDSHKSNFGASAGTYDIYLTVGDKYKAAQVWVVKK